MQPEPYTDMELAVKHIDVPGMHTGPQKVLGRRELRPPRTRRATALAVVVAGLLPSVVPRFLQPIPLCLNRQEPAVRTRTARYRRYAYRSEDLDIPIRYGQLCPNRNALPKVAHDQRDRESVVMAAESDVQNVEVRLARMILGAIREGSQTRSRIRLTM